MRKKDDVSAQLVEIDTLDFDSAGPSKSKSKCSKLVRRDGPGKQQHNASEKNRRNLMKHDIDRLRIVLRLDEDVDKQTMLSLLRKAKLLIRNLETKEKKHLLFKEALLKEQQYLKRRLSQLQHLCNGGAIGLGNTLLLSALNVPSQSQPSSSATSIPGIEETTRPHILKKRQVLLTSRPADEQQVVITEVKSSSNNILNPDNFCLVMDELEYQEGISYFGGPPLPEQLDPVDQSQLEVEYNVEVETEYENQGIFSLSLADEERSSSFQ